MDTDCCPKCDATTVVGGRLGDNRKAHKWFEPSGMRFFNFRLRGWGISCLDPIRACLSCGHVWTSLKPEELRTFIEKHGTAETKLKLLPFQKCPPDQDLV